MKRTLALETPKKIGKKVTLFGWVNSRRDHGKLIFIDLRDRSGIVQVVIGEEAGDIRSEFVIEVAGIIRKRPKEMVNPKLETGVVEVKAEKVEVLARSKTPPFDLYGEGYEMEDGLRLKYRYLDLRRPRLQQNLKVRDRFIRLVRDYLYSQDFVEIETPLLTKSTPEGARDFVVPSRLHPGKFYALPQAPQQYKQLLMVAGFERYFQIARALRDEDLRADRGFEHTQIDLEMSFVTQQEVMELVEEMVIKVVEGLGYQIARKPFSALTYQEAMKKYGSDRPDLRTEKQKKSSALAFAWVKDFPFFEKTKEGTWTFTHNPFSDPILEHKEKFLAGEIEGVLTTQYDLICNGAEIGGGSVRSTDPRILRRVFKTLGYKEAEIEKQFGHMLEAFTYGVPPHGGIAIGVERLLMTLLREEYLREVQAFPVTSSGQTSVMEAPSELSEKQLKELGIRVVRKRKRKGGL